MAIICEVCGKRMITQKILELHINKRHGGDENKEKTVIKPEEPKEEKEVEVKSTSGFATPTPEPKEDPNTVDLISADGRVLEVSVGKVIWNGTTITIPKDMEEEVRRLLEAGGFYLKN